MCHREHLGVEAALATLSNTQCQSCHTSQFAGFDNGHPPFTSYPHRRPARLVFSHRTHIGKHFDEDTTGTAPDVCTACHAPSDDGRDMRVNGFDHDCGSCHQKQIRGPAQVDELGVAFLVLPSLDTDTLRNAGVVIGGWPADSAYTETAITPFMHWMLSHDPTVRHDLSVLRDVNPLDLTGASQEQLSAVGRVAWAVKRLFLAIESGGHTALRARVEA
ncbi:MAG: hypothetical protein QF735_13910, partial [Phycisphaeraceae bacterium]|nr:hypothetical protein [Phycisphaeraceae bacterium]